MLPKWAQLLDVAARLCPVSQETREWFGRFAHGSGVDDARTVAAELANLQSSLRAHGDVIVLQLQRTREDGQAAQILAAWRYALETMTQASVAKKTCSWIVEGAEDAEGGLEDGEITVRRV